MIRDTFETNPGLCELFKRKILDRAQYVGLNIDQIDFEAQIDMKGSYHDNLRTFYRQYPQLAQVSDYSKLKHLRPLSGAALEETWLSYERRYSREFAAPGLAMPELTVTYTVGAQPERPTSNPPETIPAHIVRLQPEAIHPPPNHTELVRLLIQRMTTMAGEGFTKTILQQVGKEIGRTAFHHLKNENPAGDLAAALDHALLSRGLGRVLSLERTDDESRVTFTCTIAECSICRDKAARSSACDIMRGILSRWLESLLQKKAEDIEETCFDVGTHRCIFKFTFKK